MKYNITARSLDNTDILEVGIQFVQEILYNPKYFNDTIEDVNFPSSGQIVLNPYVNSFVTMSKSISSLRLVPSISRYTGIPKKVYNSSTWKPTIPFLT